MMSVFCTVYYFNNNSLILLVIGVCNHAFHFHCIRRWLTTRQVCPLGQQNMDPSLISAFLVVCIFLIFIQLHLELVLSYLRNMQITANGSSRSMGTRLDQTWPPRISKAFQFPPVLFRIATIFSLRELDLVLNHLFT